MGLKYNRIKTSPTSIRAANVAEKRHIHTGYTLHCITAARAPINTGQAYVLDEVFLFYIFAVARMFRIHLL
jgi:hypothetical protein